MLADLGRQGVRRSWLLSKLCANSATSRLEVVRDQASNPIYVHAKEYTSVTIILDELECETNA